MNAIISLDSTITSGGGQVILRNLSKKNKHTVLFCPLGSLADEAERLCQVIRLTRNDTDTKAVRALKSKIDQSGPFKTIHIHGISALFLGVFAARHGTKNLVYTEHLLTKHYHLESPLHYWVQLLFYRWLIRRVDHVYCVSAAVMQFLREKIKVPAEKLSIVYNPVPKLTPPISSQKPQPAAKRQLQVVTIGGLVYIKNYVQLLHILKKIPQTVNFHVTIFGDGPERNDLMALSAHLGLTQRVTFAGALPHEELVKKLFEADVYVQTSISESFGHGIAEAMQAGLPVVAFAVGGIPELVQDGVSGKLIAPYNEQEFALAIQELLTNHQLRERLARNAQKSIARYET